MERWNFLEEIRIWEHPPESGIAQTGEMNKIIFKGNQTDLLQHHSKTHRGMMWSWKWFLVHVRRFYLPSPRGPKFKLYMPKKDHFLFPMRYMDVNRTTYTSLDVLLGKYWRLLERAWRSRIVIYVDRIHKICSAKGKGHRKDTHGLGRRLTRKQTTSRLDNVWPDMWKHMSDASKRKEKQKWAIEKPKLENARRLRGIFFIEPDNEEFKDIMKNARRKLEIPMPAAMPCKLQQSVYRETCRTVGQHKTKDALSQYNLVHRFIPMPQVFKIPDAKAALEKEWENWRKYRHGTWRKSKTKVRWSMKQGLRAILFILCRWWNLCHVTNSELEPQHQKYKGRVVLRGGIVKDDSASHAVFTEQWSSASQMTAVKVMDIISRLPGCSGQAANAASAYTQVKMEGASTLFTVTKSECPDIWMRLPKQKWPKSWVRYGRPSRSSWAKSVRSSLGRTTMGKAIWESYIGTRMGKILNWECLFANREKEVFLSLYVDDIKLAR